MHKLTERWCRLMESNLPSQKLSHYILSEGEGDSPVILSPPNNVLVRIRPQQITQQPGVRNVCKEFERESVCGVCVWSERERAREREVGGQIVVR